MTAAMAVQDLVEPRSGSSLVPERACGSQRGSTSTTRRRPGRRPLPHLSPEPIRVALSIKGVTYQELADRVGLRQKTVMRYMWRPLSVFTVDRLVCALGLHPLEIYGADWTAAGHE